MRNLKILGVALVAVFAFSAMSATGAFAQGKITSPTSPFWLHGNDEPNTTTPLTAFGAPVECEIATYTGGKVGETNGSHHVGLTSGATAFTVTPHYTGCKVNNTFPVTITMNGCDYDIRILGTAGSSLYNTEADLVCPDGKEVTVDIFLGADDGTPECVLHIPPREELVGGTLRDEGNGHLTLGGGVQGITVNEPLPSPCNGGTPRHTSTAVLDLAVTITGESAATNGNKVNLSLSD